ncbi:hypothetical protein HUA74_22035 [Myxococcus sp. CA051A]|uniref:Uncharacterized protein n=1 Tax=Myxococcus llanfairpwllgwyngyllgogerychwyrndrobwllllantysiliogogogochensis TaxID=2590453 RepID=A0A540WKM8_9BACT|nr:MULTISPECIES: hypothetical protein [Myxococcus]NTX05938.1 hypothetical protein [Myxococcus sp. CA040A]NTX10549.1 hypothetical protein [Myxococcus sp. CA056]NTX38184.1 hypothetical protein [Myxococcus sp. CA033]NTX58057.1 hypothetical protein [Myxococcus sp. CA039A]NTX63336.1 hypothetical protein [Myxococcus sp. CA051A]
MGTGNKKNDPSKGGGAGGHHKPTFAKDRVERGLEADDTLPLYAADSIRSTREQKFALDSDGPVGGDVPDIRSPIDEADELERERQGRERALERQVEEED